MKKATPFNQLRLWWPAFGIGVPITSYGYPGDSCGTFTAGGPGYVFYVQKEYDCWVSPEGFKVPLSGCALSAVQNGVLVDLGEKFSFTQLPNGRVQINLLTDAGDYGYNIRMANPEDLFIVGEYFEDDD